jgi:mono/diheme cytochrome c family protein
MSRQYRFLALSTTFALSTLIFFVALFGAEPATANIQQATADAEGPQGDLERGRYLVQVAGCSGCHGAPNLASGGPPPLAGGREFNLGPLGTVYALNLTTLQDWGFEEFDMALRQGIDPYSKRTLLPAMPYMVYHRMSDADVASIGAYLKSLTPVQNDIPAAKLGDAAQNLKPLPQESIPSPAMNSSAAYGQYLVEAVANCGNCHNPRNAAGAVVQGREYSGGTRNLGTQDNPMYAPAITGNALAAEGYSRENFAATLRLGIRPRGAPLAPQMPWRRYANMPDNDLTAVWNFLQSRRLANPWPVQTPAATRAATAAATQAPPVAATEDTAGPAATESR